MSEYLKQIEVIIKAVATESVKIMAINDMCQGYVANERIKRHDEANLLYDPTLFERTRLVIT